jgi:hypothetical protein
MFEHTLRPYQHVIVPVSKNTKAASRKIAIAVPISFALVVLSAIGLDDQSKFETDKIHHPRPNGYLAAEFGAGKPTSPKEAP